MAIEFMNIAWCASRKSKKNQNGLTPPEKFTLVLMADCANQEEADGIFPSLDYIAENTGYSRRTVQEAIKGLKEKGLIELVNPSNQKKFSAGRYKYRRTAEYKLNIDSILEIANPRVAVKRRVALPQKTQAGAATVSNAPEQEPRRYPGRSRTGTQAGAANNPSLEPSNNNIHEKGFSNKAVKDQIKDKVPALIAELEAANREGVNNGIWYESDIIAVRKRAFEQMMNRFSIGHEELIDVLNHQTSYLSNKSIQVQKKWLKLTVSYLNTGARPSGRG